MRGRGAGVRGHIRAGAGLGRQAGSRYSLSESQRRRLRRITSYSVAVTAKAAESGLKFSGGGDTALATASSSQGSMTVPWPTKLPPPSYSGASATYPDVLPGVNLVVTAETTGSFEEPPIVENATTPKDPGLAKLILGMALSKDLTTSADKPGTVTVKNAKGKTVFTSPAPRAWDSSKRAKPVAVPVSYKAGKATTTELDATYNGNVSVGDDIRKSPGRTGCDRDFDIVRRQGLEPRTR